MNKKKNQHELKKIKKKYKNDKDKLNQAQMELYKEHNANPLSGCLPLIIQLPIMFAIYRIVYRPLTYIMKVDLYQYYNKVQKTLETTQEKANAIVEYILNTNLEKEKEFVGLVNDKMSASNIVDAAQKAIDNKENVIELIRNSGFLDGTMNLVQSAFDSIVNVVEGSFAVVEIGIAKSLDLINFKFLGLDLSSVPDFKSPSVLWLIPILAAGMTYLVSKVSQQSSGQSAASGQSQQMSNTMTSIFPLMTLFFAFSLPSGVGLYWITQSLFQLLQTLVINKLISDKDKPKEVEVLNE